MIPNVARPVASGERPPVEGGTAGTSPPATSRRDTAHAGSNCSIASATTVTSVKVPTRITEIASIAA